MEYKGYQRYHIETKTAPDIVRWPSRFRVKVKKHRLALHILTEFIRYRTRLKVIFSRPCIYEVFGRPVGGMAPREWMCVGCLRCTTERPDWVRIHRNPEFERQGDSYFRAEFIDTIRYEAETGRIPVKGAGYRGKFGGEGWDGMWTDMSEIVRPTRDGIHGREFISTVADIGEKPVFLNFDEQGQPIGRTPKVISIPLPILLDAPPISVVSLTLLNIFAETARQCETLTIIPISTISKFKLAGSHIVPLVSPEERETLRNLSYEPRMIEMAGWDEPLYTRIKAWFPSSLVCLRLAYEDQFQKKLLDFYKAGMRIFHMVADYHGQGENGGFVLDLIRQAHLTFVNEACRDEVTLLGSGGIIAAEHVAKAIICGLDAVALETAPLVALQAKIIGECVDPETAQLQFSRKLTMDWGVQRLKNLLASWRDQMLEVLGAMGLREVRRLRGEIGRAMFQEELEREAYKGITGYGEN
jgi:hypothetical protein